MSDVVYKVLRSSSETADKVKGKSKDVAAVYEADKMDVDVDVDVSDEQKAAKAEDNQFFHVSWFRLSCLYFSSSCCSSYQSPGFQSSQSL